MRVQHVKQMTGKLHSADVAGRHCLILIVCSFLLSSLDKVNFLPSQLHMCRGDEETMYCKKKIWAFDKIRLL